MTCAALKRSIYVLYSTEYDGQYIAEVSAALKSHVCLKKLDRDFQQGLEELSQDFKT